MAVALLNGAMLVAPAATTPGIARTRSSTRVTASTPRPSAPAAPLRYTVASRTFSGS